MRIESLLRRKSGTKVTLDGVEYHFKPEPDGREFADVTNQDHIGIFLSIREGYRLAGEAPQAPAPAPIAAVKTDAPVPPMSKDPVPADLDKLDRHALADLYEKYYGHRPAPRLGEAKLIAAIQASAN